MKKLILFTTFVIVLSFSLCGCSTVNNFVSKAFGSSDYPHSANAVIKVADKNYDISCDHMEISSESLNNGLMSVKVENVDDNINYKLKFTNESGTQAYTVRNNNEYVFPLCYGDGEYEIKLLENLHDDIYRPVETTTCVSKNSDNAYLYANSYLRYDENSLPVDASFLGESYNMDNDIVNYVDDKLSYDYDKAKKAGLFNGVDVTSVSSLSKGVCLDYCALACAMYREYGVSCKISVGYCDLEPETLHCWLEVLENGEWKIIDPTFRDAQPWYDENDHNYEAQYSF